ncbi:MAG: CBS domain-containing protein [Nitrososphaerales archaeon]
MSTSNSVFSLPDQRQLRYLRESSGLTQSDLAGKCSIKKSYHSHIEAGIADPSYSVIKCLFEQIARTKVDHPIILDSIVIRNVRVVDEDDSIDKAWKLMEEGGYSQLPVVSKRGPLRLVTDQSIATHKEAKIVKDALVDGAIQLYNDLDVTVDEAREALKTHQVILIQNVSNKIIGIVTSADLNDLNFKKKRSRKGA